tara:strand:- start:5472 stop:7742 length:2271 start_codon:yes stop_codon:yes gene_type:complete
MKILKINVKYYSKILIKILFILFISFKTYANDISIEINGNDYTDELAIFSLIKDNPIEISEEYSNYLLKTLDNSMLFESVSVTAKENKYIITVKEYPNISSINFNLNERFKDEELIQFSNELNLNNLNPVSIENFKKEIIFLYESLGFNNIKINHYSNVNIETNTATLFFEIDEGTITKIKNIYFSGNKFINNQTLKSIISSKTKSLINILANNNFKKSKIINDTRKIKNHYLNNGYPDVKIDYRIEYLDSNRINIYFDIFEGNLYFFQKVEVVDNEKILNQQLSKNVNSIIKRNVEDIKNYSFEIVKNIKSEISNEIISNGIDYFEIRILEKKEDKLVSVIFDILPIKPKYTNQINIYGNSRTFDKVIRRELDIAEGDAFHKSQILSIQKKLNSLNLFKSVEVVERELGDNKIDIDINIEEKQTGTLSAGLSIGTLEGVGVIAGLKESNFYGTGRSLSLLLNTTQNRTEFTFETTDKIFYEDDVDLTYRTKYKEEDFTVSSSYKLNTFTSGFGIAYNINSKLRHSIDLDYIIKDYNITNSSTVSSVIKKSSGENVSFVLQNRLNYSTLNSYFLPKKGMLINFSNFIETPNSSNNGYLKNIITYKNYYQFDKNILSIQNKVGNIFSLNNNDVLSDNKFSLGGRWLRGFDSFGAGPRNSRTSYVGGNNLIVTKFDYSRELTNNSDFPVLLNLFNDYGLVWDNKTDPTYNHNSIRSSLGFGIKYYSAIGPIGFTWGFPIHHESYDIKRMFLFSIGNID